MKTIAIVSGGTDSITLLYELLASDTEVRALGVDYGQRHARELSSAKHICEYRSVDYKIVDLRALASIFGDNALTAAAVNVPDGHYAEETMKSTIVPNRNMIFISVAVAYALSLGFDRVAYGAHTGDHTIYPDCRPEFVSALGAAVEVADWHKVSLYAPYLHLTKAGIILRGHQLGVPYEETWSCYRGGNRHCGTCGTCVERKEAFSLAGVSDPTGYET